MVWRRNSKRMFGARKGQSGNRGTKWIQGTDSKVMVATQMKDDGIFSQGGNGKGREEWNNMIYLGSKIYKTENTLPMGGEEKATHGMRDLFRYPN